MFCAPPPLCKLVVHASAAAPSGTLVGIAQFVRDARGPPLAVGRMAVDADKIDHGVTKGKAVIVLHTWKDHLWAIGSKDEPPEAVAVLAAGGEGTDAGDDKDVGADGDGGEQGSHEPADVTDGPVSRIEEKLTPEGTVSPQNSSR
jgi:translation initiation factor 2D